MVMSKAKKAHSMREYCKCKKQQLVKVDLRDQAMLSHSNCEECAPTLLVGEVMKDVEATRYHKCHYFYMFVIYVWIMHEHHSTYCT